MYVGLQIPSFKYPGGTAAIRPKLKEIVTTAEEAGFYSLWVMDHHYQIKGLFGEAYSGRPLTRLGSVDVSEMEQVAPNREMSTQPRCHSLMSAKSSACPLPPVR